MRKKLLLLDGFSLLFRAFYGMPPAMTAPDGTHTNAVYGFLSILNKVMEDEKPDYLAVAFDTSQPTFRHEMYDGYKANRTEAPPEFKEQVPVIKGLLADMDIPVVTAPGFEADDILGTLARIAEADTDVVIVSGDRDLLQIASEGTKIVVPKTRAGKTTYEEYRPADVEKAFGVTPEKFIELKALMGDSSDNVPGLPGVGPKTAEKILTQFGSIENARAHLAEIKPAKAMEAMRDHFDLLELSLKLVTIRTDAPVGFDREAFKAGSFYNERSLETFRRLGFRSFLAKAKAAGEAGAKNESNSAAVDEDGFEAAPADAVPFDQPENKGFETITDPARIAGILGQAKEAEACGICLIKKDGAVTGCALALRDGVRILLPASPSALKEEAGALLAAGPEIAGTNIKELLKWLLAGDGNAAALAKETAWLPHLFDVIIASYLLNPLKNDWTYDAVAAGCLSETVPAEKEAGGAEMTAAYAAGTALAAMPVLKERLEAAEMDKLFREIEMPLTFVLATMENEGILASREELARYSAKLGARIEELTAAVYEEAGETFNLNSPKQLAHILFEKMQLPGGKKTKTGYSTAADVLEKLAEDNPIVANILEYRTYAKLKSTYADGLAAFIEEDGRIRTSFNQTITATGRLSSTEPNLQNIPMRMELGRLIRKSFYPAEGCVFADADYSQIELRILAHMSGDEKLIEAYRNARDIHRATAAEVFHVPFEEVTDLMRRNAKAVNFGIVYGISSFGLSQGLSITRQEAADYIARYFETYPKIKAFLDAQVADAKERGYAVSLFGRRRPIPELRAANYMQRSFGERAAMNSPIQGTAADIMKIGMIRVWRRLGKEGLRAKMILQIHDELLVETPEAEAEAVKRILEEEMRAAADLKVTLEVDAHFGSDWYEAK